MFEIGTARGWSGRGWVIGGLAAFALLAPGCGSYSADQASPGTALSTSEPAASPIAEPSAASEEQATTSTGPTVPVASPVAHEGGPVPATGGDEAERAASNPGIPASTRRTATGLSNEIIGYQAWFRLKSSGPLPQLGEAEEVHLPARQAFLRTSAMDTTQVGKPVRLPLESGTVLVLESKQASTDYVEALSVLTRTPTGWVPQQFERTSGSSPFAAAPDAALSNCLGCHAKAAGTENVYSPLVPE